MKKLFTFFSICIIASILLASCGSHITIKKRLYSKGYYVSNGNIKSEGSTGIDESNETKGTSIDNSKDFSSKLSLQSNEDNSIVKVIPKLEKEETAKESVVESKEKNVVSIKEDRRIFSNPFLDKLQISKFQNKSFASKSMKATSEGLSLFWLVILILLILWAIGYFGTSIGSLINLLLLVALILLILWLLRVI
jgi:hypothetical protein